ncbi:hypothetical protein Asi02nite_71690 [Asanoa siamensis]|uniref:Uncharacterized protein n=1 Tax=Asanoa siamensis TaxID=926357 RepID=A0ABQ4D285_9ACTN|nr:hypothetical protein Asi02nite_71690 [Asanoa siamensis]
MVASTIRRDVRLKDGPHFGDEDRAFLAECGVAVNRRPWKATKASR